MNYPILVRRGRLVLALVTIVGAGTITAVVWRSAAIQRNQSAEAKLKGRAALRDGIGSEMTFAGNEANCRPSVESLSQFMSTRSGVKLNGQTKTRLARMEANTLAGANRRISSEELAEILATTAVERISRLTDSEIDHAAETLRGFDASDLPESFRRGRDKVKLRATSQAALRPITSRHS